MSTKRVSPLDNPPSEKPENNNYPVVDIRSGRGMGVSKGGKGRVRPAEALLKCLMCGHSQKVVFAVGKPPEWHKCIWCNQVQPADGYRVTAYGRGLPQPLAPHEVEARKRERGQS